MLEGPAYLPEPTEQVPVLPEQPRGPQARFDQETPQLYEETPQLHPEETPFLP